MLRVDRTWQRGLFYVNLVGGLHDEVMLGITIAYSRDLYYCWGRRITFHLLWWSLSIGFDLPEAR